MFQITYTMPGQSTVTERGLTAVDAVSVLRMSAARVETNWLLAGWRGPCAAVTTTQSSAATRLNQNGEMRWTTNYRYG
jgi:hypothetical protein